MASLRLRLSRPADNLFHGHVVVSPTHLLLCFFDLFEESWEVQESPGKGPGGSWDVLGTPGKSWEVSGSPGKSCEVLGSFGKLWEIL